MNLCEESSYIFSDVKRGEVLRKELTSDHSSVPSRNCALFKNHFQHKKGDESCLNLNIFGRETAHSNYSIVVIRSAKIGAQNFQKYLVNRQIGN